jgi:hypothetical protein
MAPISAGFRRANSDGPDIKITGAFSFSADRRTTSIVSAFHTQNDGTA